MKCSGFLGITCWWTGDPFWARGSFWPVGAGLLAGVFGLIDFLSIGWARDHTVGWIHFIGNTAVLILALVSLMLRRPEPTDAVLPWGLVLSVIIAGILLVTGGIGGELTFCHMIGVAGYSSLRNIVEVKAVNLQAPNSVFPL